MEPIKIHADELFYDTNCIIVLQKTGIVYTAQAGGLSCLHPEAEGYAFGFSFQFGEDCAIGCAELNYYPEHDNERKRSLREKVAIEFDKQAKAYCEGTTFQVSFDWMRLNDLKEGWIPVLLNGSTYQVDAKFKMTKAIFVCGNCD